MENPPSSATGAINLGAAAYYDGRIEDARALFARALLLEPDNELGWLWFATVTTDPAEQRFCLNRAMAINPESTALQRLVLLPPGPAATPPDLVQLDKPPLPPDLAEFKPTALPVLPRTVIERRTRARAAARPTRVLPLATAGDDAETAAEPPMPTVAHRQPPWLNWLLVAIALVIMGAAIAATLLLPRRATGVGYTIAYAGPLSGPDARIGQEQLRAVQLAVAEINDGAGVNGHPMRVLGFDDQNDPARAKTVAEEIVANEDVLLVIGHDRSDASMAAAPVYAAAGIVAITPSSTADAVTATDPWYFRAVFTNSAEGGLVSAYVQRALKQTRASVVSAPRAYESSLASAFAEEFAKGGTVANEWQLDPANLDASIQTVVGELKAASDPGTLFLALDSDLATPFLLAARRAGITTQMIGGEALGYEDFAEVFETEPEEIDQPGFFTNGLYVASPLIYDSLGGDALAFSERFRAAYGTSPEWFGAKAYDAATLADHALAVLPGPNLLPADAAAHREQVRDALAAIDSPANAVPGLSGPLYFNAERSIPEALSFGIFDRDRLQSAPIQYRVVADPGRFDLAADKAAGIAFDLNGVTLRQYRVAYIGVDINDIANLNPQAQQFDADFFFWLRYAGDKSAENIFFTNAENPDTPLPTPLDSSVTDGNTFSMYRIHGTFNQPMAFQDYPWDEHVLTIGAQNITLSENDIVYVPDQANIGQPQAQRLLSGVDLTVPFNKIPSWIASRVFYTQDTDTGRSTTPDPRTGIPEYDNYSTYEVQVSYARDVRAFLLKNLLPLALLALVTYISLFFSPESASTRIGFSITAILTTSVMLQSIANALPEIGYTVAIEWGYYVYIGLSAILVLINITIDRWYKQKRFAAVRQLDLFARTMYPIVLIAVVAVYVLRFGVG